MKNIKFVNLTLKTPSVDLEKDLFFHNKKLNKFYYELGKFEQYSKNLNNFDKAFLNKNATKEYFHIKNVFSKSATLASFNIEATKVSDLAMDYNEETQTTKKIILSSKENKQQNLHYLNFVAFMQNKLLINLDKPELSIKYLKNLHYEVFYRKDFPIEAENYKPGVMKNELKIDNEVTTEYRDINLTKFFINHKSIEFYLSSLFEWIEKSELDIVIKAILLNIYLVAIHPFIDGNGRITRLFVDKYLNYHLNVFLPIDQALFMYDKEYKINLNKAHLENNFHDAINFFLDCYIKQIEIDTKYIKLLREETEKLNSELIELGLSKKYSHTFSQLLLTKRSFTFTSVKEIDLIENYVMDRRTFDEYIEKMEKNNIVSRLTLAEKTKENIYLSNKVINYQVK